MPQLVKGNDKLKKENDSEQKSLNESMNDYHCELFNQDINPSFISGQKDKEIILEESSRGALTLDSLTNCHVHCKKPIDSSVIIRNCHKCTIKLYAHQVIKETN